MRKENGRGAQQQMVETDVDESPRRETLHMLAKMTVEIVMQHSQYCVMPVL